MIQAGSCSLEHGAQVPDRLMGPVANGALDELAADILGQLAGAEDEAVGYDGLVQDRPWSRSIRCEDGSLAHFGRLLLDGRCAEGLCLYRSAVLGPLCVLCLRQENIFDCHESEHF